MKILYWRFSYKVINVAKTIQISAQHGDNLIRMQRADQFGKALLLQNTIW